MKSNTKAFEHRIEILKSARQLANYAMEQGISSGQQAHRPIYNHMGALLADSILQAGLNYASVVKPRIEYILTEHLEKNTTLALIELIESQQTSQFLNWSHKTKITRFEATVHFLHSHSINSSTELRDNLEKSSFGDKLRQIDGIGPKTIDYMKCLVGIDSIAVDRHIRTFAQNAGVKYSDYDFLHKSFCSAADLLSISRRGFDSWVWNTLSMTKDSQQSLLF